MEIKKLLFVNLIILGSIFTMNAQSGAWAYGTKLIKTNSNNDTVRIGASPFSIYCKGWLNINKPGDAPSGAGYVNGHIILNSGGICNSFGVDSVLQYSWIQSRDVDGNYLPLVFNPHFGNVGVGLTAPASKFHSAGGISTGIPNGGLGGASSTTGFLSLYNSTNTNQVYIYSGTTDTSYAMFLPIHQGAANSVLTNNGSGNLSWSNGSSFISGSAWSLTGNSGTSISTNFIGTTDSVSWAVRTKNIERLRVLATGNVGIGTTTPTNILSLGNTQAQKIWIENTASVNAGKALTVAAGSTVAGSNNKAGGELILQAGLGTGKGTSTISFQTGTTYSATTNTIQPMETKMTILGNGNVGISTTNPQSGRLEVINTDQTQSGIKVATTFSVAPSSKYGIENVVDIKPTADVFEAAHYNSMTVRGTQTFSITSHGGICAFSNRLHNYCTSTIKNYSAEKLILTNDSTGTITNMGGSVVSTALNSGGGTITNFYGYKVEAQTLGSTICAGFASEITASGGRYNFYSTGTAQNYLEGSLGIGVSVPSSKLNVISTTEQLRVGYDANNYLKTTVGSTGTTVMQNVGTSTLTPGPNLTIIGGDKVSSQCMLQATSYTATTTGTDIGIMMMVGSNGATHAMNILNNGKVGINCTPTYTLDVAGSIGASGTVNFSTLTASQAVFTDASKNLVAVATTGTGNVVLATTPTITTSMTVPHIVGTASAVPTYTLGAGAGNSGSSTASLTNATDVAGKISVTTGTSTQPSQTIVTIGFNASYAGSVAPTVILTPANAAAAALSGTSMVYISASTITTFTITSSATPLANTTTYEWYYHCIQ